MKIQLSIIMVLAALTGNAQAMSIQCVKNEFGLLEPTTPWRNTLGPMAEKTCSDLSFKLSGGRLPPPKVETVQSPVQNLPILSIKTDKTVMQLINRWAIQSGYKILLNGQVVSSEFPKHSVQYQDVPIAKFKNGYEPSLGFSAALSEIQKTFQLPAFKGLDFQMTLDEKAKTAVIQIQEKHK